jgi:hypothetical protein
MSFVLERDVSIYVSNALSTWNNTNTVRIRTLSGFRFNQQGSINSIKNTSLNPSGARIPIQVLEDFGWATFQFETYVSIGPQIDDPNNYLWTALTGSPFTYLGTLPNMTVRASNFSHNVAQSNELTIWFNFENIAFRLDKAIITSAEIDLGIDQIAKIKWTGVAMDLVPSATLPASSTDLRDEHSCLFNKYSTVTLQRDIGVTPIVLTGGNIKVENKINTVNITRLGRSGFPYTHYTEEVNVEGSLNMYLKTGGVQSFLNTMNIFKTLQMGESYYDAAPLWELDIYIGGQTSAKKLHLQLPTCVLNLPNLNFKDLVTVDVPFYLTR